MSSLVTLTLVLVRHGETEWNRQSRFQGQTDVPLSPVGLWQAEQVAHRLTREPLTQSVSGVWSSDLGRAIQTAETIVQALPNGPHFLHRTPLLRERSFGSWEGLVIREIHERFGPHSEPPDDAEPPQAVYDRMNQALGLMWNQAVEQAQEGANTASTVLVVGHGAALKMLLVRAMHAPLSTAARFRLDNTALCVLTFRGEEAQTAEGRIERANDTAHLVSSNPPQSEQGEATKPT